MTTMDTRAAPQLAVSDLVVVYGRGRRRLNAVDGVSFEVARGETLGIIGESGCGKTSLIRAIARLAPVTSGTILLAGPGETGGAPVSVIFQDSLLALNPRLEAWKCVAETIDPHAARIRKSQRDVAAALLREVGLDSELADRKPPQLSGGQRQRVAIARALASRAPVVLCDEPVASLDASLQADVLRTFATMRSQHHLTYLFISHDLGSIASLADRVGVMYMGKLVEMGSVSEVMQSARHPYTQMLLRSIPRIELNGPVSFSGASIGEVPDPREPPSGCRFRTRCPFAEGRCAEEVPALESSADAGDTHLVACHFWEKAADRSVAGGGGV
jgi:oligopeptide/dipeptide ABC transporter ATP-binding protein